MKKQSLLLLAMMTIVLLAHGCKWDDGFYNDFVDDKGNLVQCPQNREDGNLAYILLTDGTRCYHPERMELLDEVTRSQTVIKECNSNDCCGLALGDAKIFINAFNKK